MWRPSRSTELELSEIWEQESTYESKEVPLRKVLSLDADGCASSMAVIYSMVKQDYLMQERVVSSLGSKSSSEEVDSYCQMWSLRHFHCHKQSVNMVVVPFPQSSHA